MSMFLNVNVVSQNVSDWERAKKFYHETLDWPVIFSSDEAGWEEYAPAGGAHVSITLWQGPQPMPPSLGGTTLVLTVKDAYATTKALRARGVKCDEVISIPNMVTYGAFYDPDGNRIQFASEEVPQG